MAEAVPEAVENNEEAIEKELPNTQEAVIQIVTQEPVQEKPNDDIQKIPEEKPDPKNVERSGKIFVFEIILNTLQLSYCTEFKNRCFRGPNCVTFKFLNQEPIKIYENEPVLNECCERKLGSSTLMFLAPKEVDTARKNCFVDIELYRSTPDEEILLGCASVEITQIMKSVCAQEDALQMRRAITKEENRMKPPTLEKEATGMFSETLHPMVVLTAVPDSNCGEAGILSLFIRLTCFGPLMTTNCKMECASIPTNDDFPTYIPCTSTCPSRQ